jgi:hypothetical protein
MKAEKRERIELSECHFLNITRSICSSTALVMMLCSAEVYVSRADARTLNRSAISRQLKSSSHL